MRSPPSRTAPSVHLFGAALLWLLAGTVLLLTTLMPPYTAQLGWTPAFWFIAAPLVVLLVLEPTLPQQLMTLYRQRRSAVRNVIRH
ncbi:MAG: hypothetical protein ABI870_12640 [Rhodanobacter sp.]